MSACVYKNNFIFLLSDFSIIIYDTIEEKKKHEINDYKNLNPLEIQILYYNNLQLKKDFLLILCETKLIVMNLNKLTNEYEFSFQEKSKNFEIQFFNNFYFIIIILKKKILILNIIKDSKSKCGFSLFLYNEIYTNSNDLILSKEIFLFNNFIGIETEFNIEFYILDFSNNKSKFEKFIFEKKKNFKNELLTNNEINLLTQNLFNSNNLLNKNLDFYKQIQLTYSNLSKYFYLTYVNKIFIINSNFLNEKNSNSNADFIFIDKIIKSSVILFIKIIDPYIFLLIENKIYVYLVLDIDKCIDYQIHKKIIQIITEYFNSLTKYIKIMNDYFNLNSNPAYSSYLILWYKQEFLSMNKQIEHLFSRVKTIHELQAIMNFLTILFTQLDEQGNSSKFIYDQYFINNLKITLESIVNFCMKNEIIGVSFDLKKYEINFNNKKIILHSVAELGISIFNISMIIIEFLTKFITIKKKFIGIVFLEEFLFENILLKDFLDFIKSKIDKNISNNYDVKPFGDTNESIASSNQILINYGITIISIEKLFKFFSNEIEINNEINQTSKQSFLYLIKQINEEKINYFSNLLKVKIESHFYKFFDSQKDLLMKNSNENYDKIERAFLIFIYLIKNLTKMLKNRIVDENEIKNEIINYFILDSQYVNFLNIIGNIKNLNEFYDTEFNLSQIGSIGIEIIINGIWFVYFCVINLLNLKNENKFKNVTVNFIEDILKSWSELKNVSIDKFLKNMNFYQSNIFNYINANKNEIFKGFNFD